MTPSVISLTSTTLYTKLFQDKVISSAYTDMVRFRNTTTCGYNFLQLLLLQVHLQISIQGITVQDIPHYSSHKNLFLYVKAIITFSCLYKLRHRQYSNKELSQMFLTHLDDSRFNAEIVHSE